MDEQQKLINWILKVAVSVLAAVIAIVVLVLCVGLFLPNEQIDNNKIFEMISPAFNTIIGAFVGLLGGLSLNGGSKEKKEEPPPADISPPPAPVAPPAEEDDGHDHSKPLPEEEHVDDNRWSDDHHEEHLADHVEKHS